MADIINLLPDSVANQIAAGEVIQRPASVLKELVENAIDAEATQIQILIKDAGRTLLQVVDNGKGMSETDARMAFERHATSKIKSADDLFSIRTMGFRGEALASIAAIAQVEMRTRRSGDELGVMIEIAGTRIFKQEPVQCNIGTSIQVKNLFFNVPARRRFLKSDNVEKNHLLNEFYRIALVNTNIAFSYIDGDDEVFNIPPSNHKVRIENIFGRNTKKHWEQQLLSIQTTTNLVNIFGYVGKPEFAQKSANQYFFVNSRYMRHPYFHKSVMLAYTQLIQANDNPNYFIYFEVDPQTIDINIHPTKTEIKFENEQAIWSILSATIKESLGKFNVIPSIDFDQDGAIDIPIAPSSSEFVRPPQTNYNPNYNPFSTSGYKRQNLDWEQLYQGFEKKELNQFLPSDIRIPSTISFEEEQIRIETTDSQVENYQFKNQYILTGIKSGLLIIDQHRAHTRILFDVFIQQIESQPAISQKVLFPENLILTPDNNLIFNQMIPDLKRLGFDFEAIEECSYNITAVSSLIGTKSVIDLLLDMLDKTKNTADQYSNTLHETIALSLAESSAIRTGQRLSKEEINNLIDTLFACSNHHFTPDGKTIMTILSQGEIERKLS